MTARATPADQFNSDALSHALRLDPAAALIELAGYIREGRISLRVAGIRSGCAWSLKRGDSKTTRTEVVLDLSVHSTEPDATQQVRFDQPQWEHAMRDLLEGSGASEGTKRCL